MFGFEYLPKRSHAKSLLESMGLPVEEVASTPYSVIATAGTLTLRHYPTSQMTSSMPVFIIPSFINDNFILDLLPEKSLIQSYLNSGHEVYLLDWGCPEDHEQHLTIDNFFSLYLGYFSEVITSRHPQQKYHLVGHCLGGTLATAWAALNPQTVQTLTLLTAPIDIQGDHPLHHWATFEDFNVELCASAQASIPWAIMQMSFLALKPLQLLHKVEPYLKLSGRNQPTKQERSFWALEAWSNENINMRSQFFKFLIQDLYRKNILANGNLTINNQRISLKTLQTPCLVVVAAEDHIVSSSSHLQNKHLNPLTPLRVLQSEGGHIGALIGGRAQKNLWPNLNEWLKTYE